MNSTDTSLSHRRRITKRTVDALKPGQIAWDGETVGFGIRRQRDKKNYILKYRAGGRQRWITIGRHGSPWTPETARREARRLLGEVAAGTDPADAREQAKADLTISELCKLSRNVHSTVGLPGTWIEVDEYRRHFVRENRDRACVGRRLVVCEVRRRG